MMLEVDSASPVPAFEQVRAQLADLILSGALPAGERLPPIRQLAADLDLAPGTVARVYRELESAGLVTSRVRHGTVVEAARQRPRRDVDEQATEAARTFALAVRRLGLDLDDAVGAVRRGWAAAEPPGSR